MEREITKELLPYFSEKTQYQYYDEYKKKIKSVRNIENKFICLKGLASSTPLIGSIAFGMEKLGGGFYFRFNGKGIVVDPGIGFVTLMHQNNIFIDDIDVVIVTHNHLDHNADVRAIASLLYDYNRNKSRAVEFFDDFFSVNKMKHNIEWYLDDATYEMANSELDKGSYNKLSAFLPDTSYDILEGIKIRVFNTDHIKNCKNTYGLVLEFYEDNEVYKWGYTSDTKYFENLNQYLNGCDVCILNISDIYPKDIKGLVAKNSHLGFDGCINILKECTFNVALISEFCCMNGDYRHEIVKSMRKYVSQDVSIFAAEKGMSVSIDGKSMYCSRCGKDELFKDIKCVRPRNEFEELEYICHDCLI